MLQQSEAVWADACTAFLQTGSIDMRRPPALGDNSIVSSAVDTRHSTDSSGGSGAKTSGENHAARQAQPGMNAVACEVHVVATGARPAEKGGQRELFTEETTTALVFENGGVLRLAAAVVPGQLLFLTHVETKREVVAQVTRKRDFRPTICYVEVEFSEPAPGFWGIEFPKVDTHAAPHARQGAGNESAQAAEDILAGEPAEPPTAPSAQEISALKDEVEVLREQLKLLQTQMVGGSSPALAASPEPAHATPPQHPQTPVDVPSPTLVHTAAPVEPLPKLSSAAGGAPQQSPAGHLSAQAIANVALPPAPALPQADSGEPPFNEDDLLPKPALDFKDAKAPARQTSENRQKVAARGGPAAMRKDLLFAAFVLITAGAAWYQNLLPWLSHSKNSPSTQVASSTSPPAAHTPQKHANADSVKPTLTTVAPTNTTSADSQAAPQPEPLRAAPPSTTVASETPTAGRPEADAAANAESVPEKPVVAASAGKRAAMPPLNKAAMVSAVPASDGAAVVPPKLIKSVRAIASPNALQDFAGGSADNVMFDALVDTSGRVKSMKAISGRAALRNAAMEALKQYRYEPATRQGKPVPAHVTVTVKFLFEP
jgi:protein TonB